MIGWLLNLAFGASGMALGTVGGVPYGTIEAGLSGNNTVLAAFTDRKIRVVQVTLMVAAPVTIRWRSGPSTNLSGPLALVASGGYSSMYDFGLFETDVNAALVLNLSAAVSVGGHFVYTII
jgi:hypothetical protein